MTNLANQAVEAAVQTYLATMTPDQLAKSNSYFEGGYWLQLWNLVYGLAVAWLLMRTGWSVKMRQRAEKWTRFAFMRTWIYYIQYILLVSLLTFPLTGYQEYFREHQYELSNLTFGGWTLEQLKGLGIGLVLGGVFTGFIYWVIGRLRTTWWIWGTAVSTAFLVFTIMIAPVYLAPIFNKYTPLPDGEVREAVLAMARANGVPADEVYLFDASKQSKRVSANVSGMFGTTRISLNDNLLNRASLAEIRDVMGHELGHYVLHHVQKTVLEFALVLLLGFYFLYFSMNWYVRKYGQAHGIKSVADTAGLPVMVMLMGIFMTLMTPVTNTITRVSEVEADQFGLNLAREPDGFAKVAVKLSEYRKMSPGYWEEIIFYDHPSGENRIRMAMTWKEESLKLVPKD